MRLGQIGLRLIHGLVLMLVLINVNPIFTSQSCDISTRKKRKSLSVWCVLMLMSTQFSLAYKCACVFVYTYALVEIRLKML